MNTRQAVAIRYLEVAFWSVAAAIGVWGVIQYHQVDQVAEVGPTPEHLMSLGLPVGESDAGDEVHLIVDYVCPFSRQLLGEIQNQEIVGLHIHALPMLPAESGSRAAQAVRCAGHLASVGPIHRFLSDSESIPSDRELGERFSEGQVDDFVECMTDLSVRTFVLRHTMLARDSGVRSTPALIGPEGVVFGYEAVLAELQGN